MARGSASRTINTARPHHPAMRLFRDRADAGRQLAERLREQRFTRPIVLALPRGGVPVGYEIAHALDAPLDVFLVRKLGAPGHRELGIGALAPDGRCILNETAIQMLGITAEQVAAVAGEERTELDRRLHRFRGDRPLPDLRGRDVILVDDGLATGVTSLAAIRALRAQEPARIVLAVPACAPETAATLAAEVDDLVCLHAPDDFGAVGLWYRDFSQTFDEEVVDLLERARQQTGPAEGEAPLPRDSK